MIDPTGLQSTTAEIVPGITIGGAYAPIPAATTLVVTLDEAAPPIDRPGVSEARHPFPDSRWHPIDTGRLRAAIDAATAPPHHVLIRCRHGINRSALVAALLLRERGWNSQDAIDTIRRARPGALTNPYYRDLICEWPNDPMA